jgi:GxxExxY protein
MSIAGMNANEREYANLLFEKVVGSCYEVSNVLGAGFLEKVYEPALVRELEMRGHKAEAQVLLRVCYKGEMVGEYFVDILVDGQLIVELKCCDKLCDEHLAQCLNYLKATGYPLALLVNFQHPKVEWRRVVNRF